MCGTSERHGVLSQIRLLCATSVPSTLVIPDVLASLHQIVPAEGYVFTWFGERGDLAGMYCEPPLDRPAPNLLKAPQRLLSEAGYRNDHLRPQSMSGHVAQISVSPEFKRSAFYEQMCRPAGVDHGWDGFIRVGGQVRAVLALWRSRQAPPLTSEEESRLLGAFPYLSHLLALEGAEAPADGRLLACDEQGFALVDPQGRIVHTCTQARRLLWFLAHPAFRAEGAVGGASADSADAIGEVAQRLTALLRGQPAAVPSLELSNPWGAFSVRGFVLHGADSASEAMLGLQLTRMLPSEVVAVRRMAELPLSIKQKELCLHLVRGCKPAQIEVALGIKPTTQKDYLLRIYEKLQIGTREELFDRLLRPAPPRKVDQDLAVFLSR